ALPIYQNRACLEEPDQGTPSFIHKWGSQNADPDLLIQYPYEHVIRRGINISLPRYLTPAFAGGLTQRSHGAESQQTGQGKPREPAENMQNEAIFELTSSYLSSAQLLHGPQCQIPWPAPGS